MSAGISGPAMQFSVRHRIRNTQRALFAGRVLCCSGCGIVRLSRANHLQSAVRHEFDNSSVHKLRAESTAALCLAASARPRLPCRMRQANTECMRHHVALRPMLHSRFQSALLLLPDGAGAHRSRSSSGQVTCQLLPVHMLPRTLALSCAQANRVGSAGRHAQGKASRVPVMQHRAQVSGRSPPTELSIRPV